jgi:hypothetical protein
MSPRRYKPQRTYHSADWRMGRAYNPPAARTLARGPTPPHLTSPHTTSPHLTPPHTTSHHLTPPHTIPRDARAVTRRTKVSTRFASVSFWRASACRVSCVISRHRLASFNASISESEMSRWVFSAWGGGEGSAGCGARVRAFHQPLPFHATAVAPARAPGSESHDGNPVARAPRPRWHTDMGWSHAQTARSPSHTALNAPHGAAQCSTHPTQLHPGVS